MFVLQQPLGQSHEYPALSLPCFYLGITVADLLILKNCISCLSRAGNNSLFLFQLLSHSSILLILLSHDACASSCDIAHTQVQNHINTN